MGSCRLIADECTLCPEKKKHVGSFTINLKLRRNFCQITCYSVLHIDSVT